MTIEKNCLKARCQYNIDRVEDGAPTVPITKLIPKHINKILKPRKKTKLVCIASSI